MFKRQYDYLTMEKEKKILLNIHGFEFYLKLSLRSGHENILISHYRIFLPNEY